MEFCRKIQKDWFRHQKRSGASWMNACVLLDRLCQDATQTFQVEVEGWSSTNDEDGGNTPAPWRLHVLYPLASMSWISKNTPASLRYARKHLSSPIFQVLWFFEGKALKIRNCRDWIVLLGPLPLLPLSIHTSWNVMTLSRSAEAHLEKNWGSFRDRKRKRNQKETTPADELIMQYACVFESFSLFFEEASWLRL